MTALYRKYRSKTLSDIVGQRHITDLLAKAVEAGRISHAYLLTGPKGVGKTSVARILAHQINELPYTDDSTHLDIIEIDAASNNGVEDIRDLREKVRLAPVSAKKKVYIIDEVHMLSKPAFNALLKTLEEPPEHIVFILATTDVDKLPATIISRTQRFAFRPISVPDAVEHLRYIAKQESIPVNDDALALIAEHGDGSFRDSISILDQLSSFADKKDGITAELVESILGLASSSSIDAIFAAISDHDGATVVTLVNDAINKGVGPIALTNQLLARVQPDIITSEQSLALFDGLLEVRQSFQPVLKLISVLANAASLPAAERPTTVALATPVREVRASVESLKKQPKDDKSSPVKTASEEPKSAPSNPTTQFNWDGLIEYTRVNYVALFSVLSKCAHELSDGQLIIYARNAFYKKKLDDTKYGSMLHKALHHNVGYELSVHILATAPPPKDSQAAQIAAIMGGGEEVAVDAA